MLFRSLKSEERRCRTAAKAFPELVEELLTDLEVGGMDSLATKRLNSSVVGRVRDRFEQSADEVQKAVQKAEVLLERVQHNIKDSLASEIRRQEINSLRARSVYSVEHARPVEERAAIGLVNGLSTRVLRGSRLRPYLENP